MIQLDRLLPGQDQLADRPRRRRWSSGTAARCPAGSTTWSRCPASAARPPTSCSATRSACPASPSTRTSAGWPGGSAGPTETDPVKVEAEVGALFPRRDWTMLSHRLIWHGRRICHAAPAGLRRVPARRRCARRTARARLDPAKAAKLVKSGARSRSRREPRGGAGALVLLAVVALRLLGCGAARSGGRRCRPPSGSPADGPRRVGRPLPACPELARAEPRGRTACPTSSCPASATGPAVRLADLRGTPTVLNVWAAWCTNCDREMPLFATCGRAGRRPGAVLRRALQGAPRLRAALRGRLRRAVPVRARRGRRPDRAGGCGPSAPPQTLFVAADGARGRAQGRRDHARPSELDRPGASSYLGRPAVSDRRADGCPTGCSRWRRRPCTCAPSSSAGSCRPPRAAEPVRC